MRASRRLYLGIPALVAAGTLAFGFSNSGGSSPKERAPVDPTVEVQHYAAVRDYTNAVTLNETKAWDDAQWAHGLELLAANYVPPAPIVTLVPVRPTPSRPHIAAAPGGGGSTGACGGATNGADAFIVRESGGNPNAHNPSGATGCYQIMGGTWAGSCSDLGPQQGASTSTQAQCASRLPLSAWSASGPT